MAAPGIALNNSLTSNYNDIHPHASIGLQSASTLAGTYAFYKINLLLAKRTPQAILRQKAVLLNKVAALQDNGFLTSRTVIEKLEIKFAPDAEAGLLVLMKNELARLITDIEWINEKLFALNEPLIDLEQLNILKKALAKIVSNPAFNADVKINKQYSAMQYNNQLSTKAVRMSWWLTKNSIKTTAQCGWYLTKVAANICWDTVKIMVKATIH
jgi:hypothetical protein